MEIFNKVINGVNAVYSVRISRDDLNEIEENHIKELSKEVRVHGFRPGKVPPRMIKGMYGVAIASQAKKDSLEKLMPFIAQEENLSRIVGFSTKVQKDDENGIECECSVVTAPAFELQDTSDAKIEKPVHKVTEDEAKVQLTDAMSQLTKWSEDASHDVAKEGDKVVAHFMINDKQQAKLIDDELSNQDIDLVLGDQYTVHEIWTSFVGKKVGDVCTITIVLPTKSKKHHEIDVKYNVQIKQILVSSKYELNDEFAKFIGYETLDEAIKEAKNRYQKKIDNISNNILERRILEYLGEKYVFEVPESMINVELREIKKALKVELNRLHKKYSPAVEEGCRNVSADRVRIGFVVSKMAEARDIKVSIAEFERYVRSVALLSPGEEKAVYEMYSKPESSAMVFGTLLEGKVLKALREEFEKNSQIIEKEISEKELYDLDNEVFDFVLNAEDMTKEEIAALENSVAEKQNDEALEKARAVAEKHDEAEKAAIDGEKSSDKAKKTTNSKTTETSDSADADATPKKKTTSRKKKTEAQ